MIIIGSLNQMGLDYYKKIYGLLIKTETVIVTWENKNYVMYKNYFKCG